MPCGLIRSFNADGFSSLYPKYKGGHPPKFTLSQPREIKKIAKAKPAEYGNSSPHLSTPTDRRVGTWAAASNVEIACAPTNSSCLSA